MAESGPSLVISNLVDFDTAWGHRNDAEGFVAGWRKPTLVWRG